MDKKVEIVFGRQPEVVEKIVKVPVRVNPKTTGEIIGDCVGNLCGLGALVGMFYFLYKLYKLTRFEPAYKKEKKDDK